MIHDNGAPYSLFIAFYLFINTIHQ